MKLFNYIIFSVLAFAACKHKPEEPAVKPPATMSLVIGNPVDYGFTDLLIFPVGANYNPKINEGDKVSKENQSNDATGNGSFDNLSFSENYSNKKYDSRASKEYINSNENDFDIRNILFFDKKTGQSRPLINDTLHILSFAIHKEFSRPLIFFRIVKRDVNGDKKYNSNDAVMLYVSDLNGLNFTRITPDNEQFFDYFYYPESETILIKTAFDIDNNKSFNNLDETNFREMKIKSPGMGREIFSKGLKDSLKSQMSVLQ